MDFTKFIIELLRALSIFFVELFKQKKAGDAVMATARIYDNMKVLIDVKKFNIHRFLIFTVTNGGKKLRTDTPQNINILHQDYRHPIDDSPKEKYVNLKTDFEYSKFMDRIYREKVADFRASDFQKDSLLWTICQGDDVYYIRAFFIKETKKGFWFCTAETCHPSEDFSDVETKLELRVRVNNIINLMR